MKLKKKTAKAACSCLLLLLLYGCASERIGISGQNTAENALVLTESDAWDVADTDSAVDGAAETENTLQTNVQHDAQNSASDIVETDGGQTRSGSTRQLTVYVCGAVRHPGVYELAEGSRIYEAVALAGGMSHEASPTAVNQAQLLTDGEMIRIPTVDEETELASEEAAQEDGLVNINTADLDELKTLPGIGDAKANSILAYREKNGAFASIEEIKNIEGIKDGVFAKLEDCIKVE